MLLELLKEAGARGAQLQLCVGQAPVFVHLGQLEVSAGAKWSREDMAQLLEQGREWGLPSEGERGIGIPGLGRCQVQVQRPWILFRPLPANLPASWEELNLPPVVAELAQLPQGLILLGGQTGSGIRTTLACLVEIIRQQQTRRLLMVGRCHDYVQTHGRGLLGSCPQISPGLLDSCDVVALWLTDPESAQQALAAAEEGKLVLALMRGLHTPNLLDRLHCWLPAGAYLQRLGDVLRGAYYQRLISAPEGPLPVTEFVSGEVASRMLGAPAPGRVYPDCLERREGCWSLLHSLQDWLEQERISSEQADRLVLSWA